MIEAIKPTLLLNISLLRIYKEYRETTPIIAEYNLATIVVYPKIFNKIYKE